MTKFDIPLVVTVPAHATVEVEASTLEEACKLVSDDILENGPDALAEEVEFTADWLHRSPVKVCLTEDALQELREKLRSILDNNNES